MMINRNFTLLWLGKIISQLGDKFYAIALAWWILQKTNSPSSMGYFLLLSMLPGILVSFYAGALTDRLNKKTILIVTDIIRGCLVLAISFLAMQNALEIWHVYVIAFALSIVTAFFEPAIQAIIPDIVERESLPKANGMSQMVGGICTVAGPLLGAVAVSLFGMAWVFLANSISYVASALFSCLIVMDELTGACGKQNHILEDLREGIYFLKAQHQITTVLKIIGMAHFFLGSLMVALPFLAKGLSGNGIKNLGYLEMMMGAGLIAGSLFMSIKKKVSINTEKLLVFIMTMGVCFIALSIAQLLHIKAVWVYMIVLTAIGLCIACASVFWQSLLQEYTPSDMTGRVFSISSLIGNVSLPVAYGIFGVLLGKSSISAIMAVCGICLLGLCCYLFFFGLDD